MITHEPKTILLVEDEAIIAIAEARTIKRFGYEVIIANSGEKAVEHAAENKNIALVLMDIDLGKGINGPESAAQILRNRSLPILFLTSHSEREMVEKVRGITRYGYVIKNSGDFVLQSSIEMAFELFDAHQNIQSKMDALRESEASYRLLFNSGRDAIAVHLFDDDGQPSTFLQVNDIACHRLGYTREEMLKLRPQDIDAPDRSAQMPAVIAALLKEKQVLFETEHITKNGQRIPVEISTIIFPYNGRNAALSAARNISERKRVEQALRESESKYRTIFENAPLGIFRSTPAGQFIEVNSALADMLGFESPQAVLNEIRSIGDQIYVRAEARSSIVEQQLRSSGMTRHQNSYRRRDGSEFSANLYLNTVRNDGGQILYLEGIVEDITERKRAEEVLQSREKRFRSIVENSADAITLLNNEGIILYESANVRRISGYEIDQRIGKSGFETIHPDDLPLVQSSLRKVLAEPGGMIESLHFRAIRPDGSVWWAEATAKNLLHDPDIQAVVINYRDISERKRSEEALLRTNGLLDSIIENIPTLLFLKDAKDLKFSLINRAVEDLIGIPRSVMLGKSDYDFVPKDQADHFAERDRQTLASNQIIDIPEEPLQTRENGLRILHTRKVPLLNANGEPEYLLGVSEDITERRRAEGALRESEEKYRMLFDLSADAIFIHDNSGKMLAANETARRRYGYSEQELLAMNVGNIDTPEEAAKAPERLAVLMEKGIFKFETEHQCKNGAVISVEADARLITYEGHPAIMSMSRDITEHRKTEAAIRESEQKFRKYIESAPVGIFLANEEGSYVLTNEEAARISGYSRDELLGMNLMRLIYHEDIPIVVEQFKTVVSTGTVIGENRFVRKNGDLGYWLLKGTKVAEGRYLGFVVDITDIKKQEFELREREGRLRAITDNMVDTILLTDRSGRLTFVNHIQPGLTLEQVLTSAVYDFVPPEQRVVVEQALHAVFDRREIYRYETLGPGVNGKPRIYDVNVSPVMAGDEVVSAVFLARDITEIKQAAEEIRRLLDKNELLMHEVHHRIKNNMNTMMSLLSLHAESMNNADAAAALKDARTRMQSMQVLYDKLYRSQNFEEVSINEYLVCLIDEITKGFPGKIKVAVNTNIEDFRLGPTVISPLGIIINELLANAMKYAFAGRDKGVITVSASLTGSHTTVTVQDDGVGIPESVDIGPSPGFGLQLVDMLTKQLEGKIRIERGNGTKFVLEFEVP